MTRPLRVAAAQMPGLDEAGVWRPDAVTAVLHDAAADGVELVVLPELATTPYFCAAPAETTRPWARAVSSDDIAAVAELTRTVGLAVLLPFFEYDPSTGRRYNAAVLLDRGTRIDAVDRRGAARPTDRKIHLPAGSLPAPGYDESDHFVAGDHLGIRRVRDITVGTLICYDRRFPECWRSLRGMGAELVLVPVAGSGTDPEGFFLAELRTHARENAVYVVAATRVGPDRVGDLVMPNIGESYVIDPEGRVLAARTPADGPGLVTAEVDPDHLTAARATNRLFEERRLDVVGADGTTCRAEGALHP